MVNISDKLELPCGVQIKNRICKGAMTEGLADEQNRATFKHVNLYDKSYIIEMLMIHDK